MKAGGNLPEYVAFNFKVKCDEGFRYLLALA